MLRREVWIAVVALVVAGCRSGGPEGKGETARTYPTPKPDPWTITCLDPTAETPALLWNGLIGVRIGRDGTGKGDTLFAIRRYDTGGEEKIQSFPNLFDEEWRFDGVKLDPVRGDKYAQKLDMKTGILTTSWTQRIGEADVDVLCEAVVHPDAALVVKGWLLSHVPKASVEFRARRWPIKGLSAPLPGQAASRFWGTGMRSGHSVTGNGNSAQGKWQNDDEFDFWRCQTQRGAEIHMERAANLDAAEVDSGFGLVAEASRKAWAKRWETDIEIDGPVEDQQAIRSFLFYLRSAIHPKGGMSISPMGLSSATYGGHVFWDADIWVFPALALIDPEAAKAIPDYRLRMFAATGQGMSSHPLKREGASNAGGDDAPPSNRSSLPASRGGGLAAPFPWESSVSGKEVAPPITRDEIHINGDVAWMLRQAAALGLSDPAKAEQVRKAVGAFYRTRATKGANGEWELRGVVSPDENHTGDNDLYTNLLAEWATGLKFKRPRDARSYLTYDNDALRGYKQAAAVLAIYPLQMVDDKQALTMMDRFADKVTKNGPAMSRSVHALIWARLGESTKAYETWKKSWGDYTNHPLLLFSEKPRKEETYFTTGAGGCLQTVLYGFLGFRLDWKQDTMTAWSKPLNGGARLSLRPNLPKAWKSVKLKNFHVLGKRLTLTVDAKGVQITQGES